MTDLETTPENVNIPEQGWYFATDGQSAGPFSLEIIEQYIVSGVIKPETLVWHKSMPDWAAAWQTPLAGLAEQLDPIPASGAIRSGRPEPVRVKADLSPEARAKMARQLKALWWVFAVGVGGASGLLKVDIIAPKVFIAAFLVGVVAFFMMIYQLWNAIQDGNPRTTPGKAVGFMFIPIFGVYWIFQAIWGLAKDINKYIREKNIPVKEVPTGVSLAASIMMLLSNFPLFEGYLAMALFVVLLTDFWLKIQAATLILTHRPVGPEETGTDRPTPEDPGRQNVSGGSGPVEPGDTENDKEDRSDLER